MEQLPGIFVYFFVAIVAPVVLARFVVRAEWRIIRNACLIWYGFLFLALGGFKSGEGFGWVLLLAMFFSIPAVPIIALVLRSWNWLGRSTIGVTSTEPALPWLQRFPFSFMSPAQWSLIALLVTGVFLGTYWYEQRDVNARAEFLRRFLGLPADAKFASIQSITSSATAPRIAAIVRFTKPQFESFSAQLANSPLWQQAPPHYDGAPIEVISPENFRWRDVPLPVQAGNRFVNWTKLSAAEVKSVRRGRALCIALHRKPWSDRKSQSSDVARYAANDCSALAKTEHVSVIVVGALDFDTRTLHMIIN